MTVIVRVRTHLRWEYLGDDLRLTPIPRHAAMWARDCVDSLAALAAADLRQKHLRAEVVEVDASAYPRLRMRGICLGATIETLEYLARCLARAAASGRGALNQEGEK